MDQRNNNHEAAKIANDNAKMNGVLKSKISADRLRLQVWLLAFAQAVPVCGMEFQD